MSDIAKHSCERQARAYLAVQKANLALVRCQEELRQAEESRLRPGTPLTVIVGDVAVTSHRKPGQGVGLGWTYLVSQVLT